MDINKINKTLGLIKANMPSEKIDEVINKIITQLTGQPSNVSEIFAKSIKNKEIEEIQPLIYKRNNYYIFNSLKAYLEDHIIGYKLAEKTGISSAPKIVKTIELPNSEMVTIVKVNGDCSKISSLEDKLESLSLTERIDILNDFKKMLNNDYINTGALEDPSTWQITADNKLSLLSWNKLNKIVSGEDKSEIIKNLKDILRINDNNPYGIMMKY